MDQFVCRLRQLTASCDFAEFEDDHIRVNLEQEGTVTLDCLLINTDK